MNRHTVLLFLWVALLTSGGCGLLPDYGKKRTFGAGELYYRDGIEEAEADKLGTYLLETGFFDEETPKSVQLLKEENTYVFRMVARPEYAEDEGFARTMEFASMELSGEVFESAPVRVELTDERFRVIRIIAPKGAFFRAGQGDVYYSFSLGEESARRAADYFKELGFFDSPVTVFFGKEGDTYVYELVAREEALDDEASVEANLAIAGMLSADVWENRPVTFRLLSADFQVLREFDFQRVKDACERNLCIPGKLTPYSGEIDPSRLDVFSKSDVKLKLFSQRISLEFYSVCF